MWVQSHSQKRELYRILKEIHHENDKSRKTS